MDKGPTAKALRQTANSTDVADTIARIQEMGDLLREVAIETQHEKPDVAARAAMGSARAASDVLGTMIVREQLDGLFERIGQLEAERRSDGRNSAMHGDRSDSIIGLNKDGIEVKRPLWGRGGLKDKTKESDDTEMDEQTTSDGSDGTANSGGCPDW